MNYRDKQPTFPLSLAAACALSLLLVLVGPLPALAATVYKTVDEKGVVSYSDKVPEGNESVEVLEIDASAPGLSETDRERLDAMRETTDRMVADRQQREKHRAELRKLQVESKPQVIQYTDPGGEDGIYSGYYPYPVYRPGGRYRPRPVHPITRPPLRPQPPAPVPEFRPISPGYDYPASLIRRGYSPEVRAAFEK